MLQLIFNYLYSLCFPFSAVCQIYLFRFAGILNRFIWNLREIITTTNRSNDYVFGQSWNRKEQGSTVRDKTQIDINRFSRHVKQVLPPSKWIHKFMAQTREDAIMDTVSRQFTDFTYKFRIKISRIFFISFNNRHRSLDFLWKCSDGTEPSIHQCYMYVCINIHTRSYWMTSSRLPFWHVQVSDKLLNFDDNGRKLLKLLTVGAERYLIFCERVRGEGRFADQWTVLCRVQQPFIRLCLLYASEWSYCETHDCVTKRQRVLNQWPHKIQHWASIKNVGSCPGVFHVSFSWFSEY